MPQDRLRSFVRCDDPKGVVECGTTRKSKSNPKRLEEKAGSQKMPKNSSSSSSSTYKEAGKEMVPEKDTEDFHNPSSCQLLEVSKGAQKLNQVIDSWSKGMNFDGNSKDIAKDLLKGALDLQESLIMLGKLQEASQYVAKLKKKQKEKSKGEKIDRVGMERTKSLRFPEHSYDIEFQKPRFSDYGCSRDFFEQKEKSVGERVYEVGSGKTNSDRFLDHDHEIKLQKPRLFDYGYPSDCFEQREKSTGERIRELDMERMNSRHFVDPSFQKGFHKPKHSFDEKSGWERIHERTKSDFFMDHNCQIGFQKPRHSADESSRGEFFRDVGIRRTNSHHIGESKDQTVLQRPRLSTDSYSRDCFDELRTVIRDSLSRQNLLPCNSFEKRDFCQKTEPDSAFGTATSSSHFSIADSHDFASSNSSLPSKHPNKPKGSNLIAKLMGIEEFPRKRLEHEKISSPRRAVCDIDMPKSGKPHPTAYKVDTEQVKLKEIVETMHFKGLLKSNAADEGLGLQYHHSNVSDSKQRFSEDAPPPIVVMRPWHNLSADQEREPRVQKLIREIEALDMSDSEGGLNSFEICRRVKKGDETPTKRISQEGGKGSKVVLAKPEEIAVKRLKTKGKLSSNKSNASAAVNQQQRKRVIDKRVDKVQKVALSRKKLEEVENVKSKGIIKSQNEARLTSPKERTEVRSIIAKNCASQQKHTSSSVLPKHAKPAVPQNIGDLKKNRNDETPVEAPLAADFVVEDKSVGCKYSDKLIDISCENEADTTIINPTAADQLLTNEGTDASAIQIDEQCDSSQDFPYDILPQTTQHESSDESAEETKHSVNLKVTETICFRTETNAEDLILSSPSFLLHAEELYGINSNNAIHLNPTSLNNHESNERRLLLDCANELMQYRILRRKQPVHPLLPIPMSCSKSTTSLSQLAEEVSNGIENLRSYGKNFREKFHKDSLLSVLERDLRCRGAVSGGWDLGWKCSFTAEEAEEVVGDVEKLVFSELLEDVFVGCIL